MLVIRDEQLAVLAEASRERFKTQVISHLRKHFPRRCEAMGPRAVRAVVDEGFERAFGYGIRLESDLCRFVELMFVCGKRFDIELPWAAAILNDVSQDPSLRLQMVCDQARRQRAGGQAP